MGSSNGVPAQVATEAAWGHGAPPPPGSIEAAQLLLLTLQCHRKPAKAEDLNKIESHYIIPKMSSI